MKFHGVVACLGLAFAQAALAAAAPAPVAKLDAGMVQGEEIQDLLVFRGIPFAAPPVGVRRWRPPAPVAHWSGVRMATRYGAACPQPKVSNDAWARVGTTDEDCLFLNVWRPAKSTPRGIPVMVFVHGGGFSLGSSGVPLYEGANLARRGVVLVTLNYRLGRLGFFAHPLLTQEDPEGLLGNYGLMDAIQALQWVQANIAQFGGDPHNVTLFGESAGAGAVQLLMASVQVSGLFNKVISESGAGGESLPTIRNGAASAEAAGKQWTDSLGPEVTLESLRALPANQVATAGGFPMIDGRLVRRAPGDSFNRGEQKRMPFIIGSNSFEESLAGYSDTYAKNILGSAYAGLLEDYKREAPQPPGAEANLRGEVDAVEPSRSLGDLAAQSGAPTFVYYFAQLPVSARGTLPGAPHGGELAYLFGNQPAEDRWDDTDRKISQLLGDYWVQFAKSGNPNTPHAPVWKPVTPATAAYLIIDADTRAAVPTALQDKTKDLALAGAASNWAAGR